jgi:predicted DNA-binding antitoxin AbrB/MazE fold protein
MITLVKALGSSLKEGEYTLTIPDAAAHAAKPWEKLHFSEGEQGQLVVSVSIDPDMAKQIEAFKLELNAEHTASSDGSLL